MKFENVIAAGCSFTWGDELVDRQQRYVKLLAHYYGANLFDYSRNGASNEQISNAVTNQCTRLLSENKINANNTLVVVQWSLKERLHFYSKSNKYYNVSWNNTDSRSLKAALHRGFVRDIEDKYIDNMDLKLFYEQHGNVPYLIYNMITRIHHAQMFLQNKNLMYVFLFAMDEDRNVLDLSKDDIQTLRHGQSVESKYTLPDTASMLSDIDRTKICDASFLDFCRMNNFAKYVGGHPVEDAHKEYSKHLIKFIEEYYG